MASDKKIVATEGREEIAGKRYSEIRDIISINSDVKFKDTIGEIAGISPGSYYNYTSENSPKYGRVSLFTVKNLSGFFSLPIEVFDCSEEFSEEAKIKIADIVRNKYTIKSNSQIMNDELMEKLKYASKMGDELPKDIIKNALEKYFIHPFMNKNHLINYFYLIEKYKLNMFKKDNISKEVKNQIEVIDKAYLYCLAYDDLIMQYIRDGEIISFENGIDFEWPNELEDQSNGITYPHFMEIVLTIYSNKYTHCFDEYDLMEDISSYGMLDVGEEEVIAMSRYLWQGKDTINNIDWYKQLIGITEEDISELSVQKYTIDEFVNSRIFEEYKSRPQKLLYAFFDKLKSEGLQVYVQLKINNTFTIYANENVGNRLCIVSVYEGSIKISTMYDYHGMHYENIEEIYKEFIDYIIKRYNDAPKYKDMSLKSPQGSFNEE